MMVTENRTIESDHMRKLLRSCLERSQAMDMETLERLTGMGGSVVREGLEILVKTGEVEVLRPLSSPRPGADTAVYREHYRLIRHTDDDYMWEQDVTLKAPCHMLSHFRKEETKLERGSAVAALRAMRMAFCEQ